MLARLVRALPEGPEWEYELKLDGYRLEAIKDGDKVRLYSRRGNDFTRKFARIAAAVSNIKAASFILDDEAAAVDAQGKPSFQMLQNRSSLPAGWSLAYYAFESMGHSRAWVRAEFFHIPSAQEAPVLRRRAPDGYYVSAAGGSPGLAARLWRGLGAFRNVS
jgi:bifunctional non-homologous end joining protein LigD